MRARRTFPFALLGLTALGCLTTPAYETGSSKRARTLVPRECNSDGLIEDGEDNDSRILVRDGRGGYWYTSVDAEGSTIQPSGNYTMGSPGHDSKYSPRMHGHMATAGWSVYASMGFKLAEAGSYDASKYSGISFWAKGPGHVRFEMPDAYTAPEGGVCKDCYNDFGIELGLSADWHRYSIPFEWLTQRPGWGDPRPSISPDKLFAVEWEFGSRGKDYDIWIDDIAFICGNEGSER